MKRHHRIGWLVLIFHFTLRAVAVPVEISWEAIEGAAKYVVEIRAKERTLVRSTMPLNVQVWKGDLAPGNYEYRVRAVDPQGVLGDWGNYEPIVIRRGAHSETVPRLTAAASSTFFLAPSLSYFRLDSTDKSSGAEASLVSALAPGVELGGEARLQDSSVLGFPVELALRNFPLREAPSRPLDPSSLLLFHFNAGVRLHLAGGTRVGLDLGYGAEPALRAVNLTETSLQRFDLFRLSANGEAMIYEGRVNDVSLRGAIRWSPGATKDGFGFERVWGFSLGARGSRRIGDSLSLLVATTLEYVISTTSLTDQKIFALSMNVGLGADLF